MKRNNLKEVLIKLFKQNKKDKKIQEASDKYRRNNVFIKTIYKITLKLCGKNIVKTIILNLKK
jgi:hypothetical protein